ncbi:flagellar biosynthesis anti-sigma factor FlgM [Caldalkalibacillus mannanilyticus]|uniref:flagellar biosynthesis anti-sigma factor FlgM n=1 Tax=Caldalkalibacillus mannanilyticus TaxID=1418 RepID=UPI00046A1394|nr:flagellar biosynthesis anti-sigma factor FlgM [Caldalkalibacillus mannanilyticus]
MKINKPPVSAVGNPYMKAQAKLAKIEPSSAARKKDELQISSEAKALLENHNTKDVARQQKVNELKQQVQNGEYKVDSEKVAEKLYQFWFKS